ncbi:DUF2922 domain-containing protein [Mahella sp.]|uniref:DUF2922 domain-containing protein n=1 Tax=Mahella sp. TaxID=2798721 RepID=UPI0025C61273|nr:DUF2922 domain-containing protein [Mahella sp.]MBZ4666788.1 hypothetical protein [Mahella sp.]
MENVLELLFENVAGRAFRITLNDPKPDLTPAQIQSAMSLVLSNDIFDLEAGPYTISGANIITTDTTPIELA